MLNSTLTEEEFRKGVIEYLRTYKFANTESEDLWNSLKQVRPFLNFYRVSNHVVLNTMDFHACCCLQVSKQPFNVAQMMNTWTVQKGFPLVTVKRNGTQVTLTQEHFLLNANNVTNDRLDCFCYYCEL